jgi:outer membrane protein OmpA-like peptidoglycan-associated protein
MKQLLVLLAALVLAGAVSADEYGGPGKGQLYLIPGIGYMDPPDDINADDSSIGPAGIVGFGLTDRVNLELLFGKNDIEYTIGGADQEDEANLVWMDLLYKPTTAWGAWQSFLLVGGGQTEYNFDNARRKLNDSQFNVGVGLFGEISPRFSVRSDIRGVYSDQSGSFKTYMFVGLTGILGAVDNKAPTDTDGDGVADRRDKCPNTPSGRTVNENGCELDSDGDGVVDGDDACPNTAAGKTVDARGCAPDADSDGDGVADLSDDCPNTPAGVAVDSNGCPVDSDGDGVADYQDKCPGSEAGAKVDAQGCYVELDETVTIDLNLQFDSNSADVRSSEYGKIQEVTDFLRQYPTTSAVLEGHTDSSGAAAYNQQLSERRARAVYNYLVNQANVAAGRLSFVGFGEANPIASNETAEGKQTNRRVSAVVSATRKVRAK